MKIKKLCLALILGIVLSACGSSSPEDIALDFTEKLYKGDTDVLNYFDLKEAKGSEKEFANGKIRSAVMEGKERADKKGGVKQIIIAEKNIEENRARIRTTVVFKDDSNTTNTFNLIKKDGKWFIELK